MRSAYNHLVSNSRFFLSLPSLPSSPLETKQTPKLHLISFVSSHLFSSCLASHRGPISCHPSFHSAAVAPFPSLSAPLDSYLIASCTRHKTCLSLPLLLKLTFYTKWMNREIEIEWVKGNFSGCSLQICCCFVKANCLHHHTSLMTLSGIWPRLSSIYRQSQGKLLQSVFGGSNIISINLIGPKLRPVTQPQRS